MTNPNPNAPAPQPQDAMDETSLDLVVGGADVPSPDLRSRQEQSKKASASSEA